MSLESLLEKIAGRREDAIGIDIGSRSIKMAEVVMRSGKPFLKKMAIFDVPDSVMKDGVIVDEALLAENSIVLEFEHVRLQWVSVEQEHQRPPPRRRGPRRL